MLIRPKKIEFRGVVALQRWRRRIGYVHGFTMVEIMVVVAILAIAAAMVIPMASSASSVQSIAAADMVYADLGYVRGLAMSHGKFYRITFDTNNESYQVLDQGGNPVSHPVKTGSDYQFSFTGSRLGNVELVSVDIEGTSAVAFDYLGRPCYYDSVSGTWKYIVDDGTIVLRAGEFTRTLTIEPETGNFSVN